MPAYGRCFAVPKIYANRAEGVVKMLETPVECNSCNMVVPFANDVLLLGSKPYNHPLFMASYVKEQKVNYILVDGGSAINIMPKSMMHALGYIIEELLKS